MWPAIDRSLDATHLHHPADLRRRLLTDGGFTVRIDSGANVSSGICVGTRPAMALSFPIDAWDDRTVDQWMSTVALAPRRTTCVGGWLDRTSGTVWLDAVHVVPSFGRRFALAIGRHTDQLCVFDLDRCETVALR